MTNHGLDVARAISQPLNKTDLLVVCNLANKDACYFGTVEFPAVFKEYLPAARKLG